MAKKILRYALHIAVVLMVFWLLSWFQARNLLTDRDTKQVSFISVNTLAEPTNRLIQLPIEGKVTVLYFFAPWCHVCKLSINNLETLKNVYKDDINVVPIALSYENIASVNDFLQARDFKLPAYLGSETLAAEFKVDVFPTYYVLNADGTISHSAVGYTTSMGLIVNTLMGEAKPDPS
ncbi:TlpA family protein disulfide reductase [Algibacillus agarilyticus]|uniref:TlpA family protein disulfide reductase n=1 Tax=Algibacillus agarilyticus TaxID=2234133 RepID=UPI000DCFB756|nr:TlpA disulfide reductase family protein [Algibacillus agarilyticus]